MNQEKDESLAMEDEVSRCAIHSSIGKIVVHEYFFLISFFI